MSKSTKRLLSLLLCLTMLAAVLAGCGGNGETPAPGGDEPQQPDTGTPSGNEDKPADNTPEQPPEEGDQPAPGNGTLPLVAEGEETPTITIGLMQKALTEDYDTNEYTKWLEEQTGINIEFVYFSDAYDEAMTQLNLMMSGNEKLPDILWGIVGYTSEYTDRNQMGEDGYLVDLDSYFEDYGYWYHENFDTLDPVYQEQIFQQGRDPNNGAMYSFPNFSVSTVDSCTSVNCLNTQWLSNLGLEKPTTVEELHDVLKAFATQDPNQNGKADEIPMIYIANGSYHSDITMWLINPFVYCNDFYMYNITDGKIWMPYDTDEYRQALIYMNQLYQEGLFSSLSWSITTSAEMKALLTPSDGTALVGLAGAHPTLYTETDNMVMAEYGGAPILKAVTDKGGYGAVCGPDYKYQISITTDCEDPVLAFRLLDFMSSLESDIRMRYGVKDEDWEFCDPADGLTDSYGRPAVITILNDIWSVQNNRNWHYNIGYFHGPNTVITSASQEPGTYTYARNLVCKENYLGYTEAPKPQEVINNLVYSGEEASRRGEFHETLKTYIMDARSLFITGAMDPNSDADWSTYLNNLELNGYSEDLAIAQSAYDRMNS